MGPNTVSNGADSGEFETSSLSPQSQPALDKFEPRFSVNHLIAHAAYQATYQLDCVSQILGLYPTSPGDGFGVSKEHWNFIPNEAALLLREMRYGSREHPPYEVWSQDPAYRFFESELRKVIDSVEEQDRFVDLERGLIDSLKTTVAAMDDGRPQIGEVMNSIIDQLSLLVERVGAKYRAELGLDLDRAFAEQHPKRHEFAWAFGCVREKLTAIHDYLAGDPIGLM